jgi:hypothetical protein
MSTKSIGFKMFCDFYKEKSKKCLEGPISIVSARVDTQKNVCTETVNSLEGEFVQKGNPV